MAATTEKYQCLTSKEKQESQQDRWELIVSTGFYENDSSYTLGRMIRIQQIG